MSLLSGRDVEGSVDGGEKVVSAAGVFGGSESRLISAIGASSGSETDSTGSSGGVMFRVIARRWRPRGFTLGSFFF